MGFRNRTWLLIFLIVWNIFLCKVRAQESQTIDLDFIYNEWVLSRFESKDGNLVYREKGDFFVNNINYRAGVSFKFTKYDDIFLPKYINPGPRRHCGYDSKTSIRRQIPKWIKGVWKLNILDEKYTLELNYLEAQKGKSYKSTSERTYQIIHLEEDKMILRKLENHI